MSKSRIMTSNYLDPSVINLASASTENTNFPSSNLYLSTRRGKTWRSGGHFDVLGGQNTIVFREAVGGPDRTATVAAGSYATAAALGLAVAAAMNAVAGTAHYSCSGPDVSENVRPFQITSNGLGGAIFTLRWTVAAGLGNLMGFDTSADKSGALIYIADVLKIHSSEWLLWDLGISSNPQALILVGPQGSPMKLTPSAVVTLQANTTNAWSSPAFSQTVPYDPNAIFLINPAGLATTPYRYWRLLIVDPSNPNGFVEIGKPYLGELFEPVRGGLQFPFSAQYIDRSTTVYSEGGQALSDTRPKTEQFQANWKFLTTAELEALDAHWQNVGTSIPFFVQLDPDGAFSGSASRYVRYVKMTAAPSYQLVSPGSFAMTMQFAEEL